MNVICLLCDSLNRHFLPAYGHDRAETPNIDWLAERAHVFEKHFSGSLPTMPTRRELWTGNHEFPWRPWGALEPWDRELPKALKDSGVLTMLITDSYHLFEGGSSNYHFHFDGWEFFRGFENDPWVTEPTPLPEHKGNLIPRYAKNMRRMVQEEDLPPCKTLRCVEQWLQKNHTQESFFLMIDEFAPHEPFNAPDYLVKKYDPDYDGPLFFWPQYGRDIYEEDEIRHLRAAYAAHVTLVDKYMGRVFETMSNLDLWENTAFILMTDHGHYLGEHGYTGKPACPQYNTLVHIPLMIYVPGAGPGGRVSALSANVDIYPTVLDLFGQAPAAPIHGRSLLPLIRGDADKVRDSALYGFFGGFSNVTDGKMTYLRAPQNDDGELNIYSQRWEFGIFRQQTPPLAEGVEYGPFMKGVDMPVGKLPMPCDYLAKRLFERHNHLYDLDRDREQNENLAGGPAEKKYVELLTRALREIDCPEEQFHRLGLE